MYSKDIDKKWQQYWEKNKVYKFDKERKDDILYILEMFSYPSGSKLHIGHWFNYAPVDTYARFKKMKGYNVFHPMGFDAFGLPAENFAIKTGVHPKDSTEQNIKNMEIQWVVLLIGIMKLKLVNLNIINGHNGYLHIYIKKGLHIEKKHR